MKWKTWAFLLVLLVSVALYVPVRRVTQAAKQRGLNQQIQILREEAAALVEQERFAQASDKLEELQVLFMDTRRYQDALETSFTIEDISAKVSNRRSPWNYVKIAEAYLGLGDQAKYLDWMEKAVYERGFSKLDYFREARLDALKGDPRYRKLVEACGEEIGVGQRARDFQVTLLDGSSFTLSAQVGKVVLIDFWDVRCGPCRKEMPNLKEIFRDFRDRGLEIVGISLDTDRRLLTDYLEEAALPWKIACSWDGWSDSTATLYRISATPSTWLIDRHGVVRYCDVRGEELRRAVQELTAES